MENHSGIKNGIYEPAAPKRERPVCALSQTQRTRIMGTIIARADLNALSSAAKKQRIWRSTVNSTKAVKRVFDISISAFSILILTPLFITVAIAIRLESRGGIIFRQTRVGKNGKHFMFYKFRSMYPDAEKRRAKLLTSNESSDGVIFKMQRDPRITRTGRFIRKFSIDELPQLFNVLIGDMSLVGPRPPLPSEVALYNLEERKRLHVLPGITCLWQVRGRSDIPFKEQVKLDKEYISSQSFKHDFIILLKTIPAVLTGRGAY